MSRICKKEGKTFKICPPKESEALGNMYVCEYVEVRRRIIFH
jgi:hypothetical protein